MNGKAVLLEKWDGLLQSVALPKSLASGAPFILSLRFQPTGWPLWAAFSCLAWLSWLGLWRERLQSVQSCNGDRCSPLFG